LGRKTRENAVVLDFLAIDNFDFTRKIVKKKNRFTYLEQTLVDEINTDFYLMMLNLLRVVLRIIPGVPTSFRQEFSKKSQNVTKKRKKLVKVCLHSS